VDDRAVYEPGCTLPAAFERVVDDYPDMPAAIFPTVGGERRVTYRDLDELGRRLATGLHKLGLTSGDPIAIWLPNCIEWLAFELAAARAGLVIAPVNTRYRADDARYVLKASGAKAVVIPLNFMGIDFVDTLKEAIGTSTLPAGTPTSVDLPELATVISVDLSGALSGIDGSDSSPHADAGPDGAVPFDQLLEAEGLDDLSELSSPLNLLSTSGTTGSPKLVAHSQDGIVRRFLAAGEFFDLRPADVMLLAVPLAGAFGLGISITTLLSGGTLVLVPGGFDPTVLVDLMGKYGVTHFHGGDDMMFAVLETAQYSRARFPHWRSGLTGNFTNRPLSEMQELIRVTDAIGLTLGNAYGCSEALSSCALWHHDASPADRALGGGECVGGTHVRAVDVETGEVLGPDEQGELQLSGPSIMTGYWRNPDATKAAFTADGWLHTGDIGKVRADGAMLYSHRLKDALRLRGYMVDPRELEEVLGQHPAVESVQIVGIPGKAGERAVAFARLVPGGQLTEAEVLEFSRSRVASYKTPHHVAFVDEFPMGDGVNGPKVLKSALRDQAIAAFPE
jgi:fatty-acyl-CoA synthase